MLKVTLVDYPREALLKMGHAAANSSGTEPKAQAAINAIKSGHDSILEFGDFHFHVEGISRACSHQLVRSRIASFCQRSQRYVREGQFEYIIPPSIQKFKDDDYYGWLYNAFVSQMVSLQNMYDVLTSNGVPNEDARFVLPNACETKLDIKMNARSLQNFFKERLCKTAQWEIRAMAVEMAQLVKGVDETLYKMICNPKCFYTQFCRENKNRSCGKYPRVNIYEGVL